MMPMMQVGNAVFGASFEYLVDLSYLWSTSTDLQLTNGTDAAYYNPGMRCAILRTYA